MIKAKTIRIVDSLNNEVKFYTQHDYDIEYKWLTDTRIHIVVDPKDKTIRRKEDFKLFLGSFNIFIEN